MPPLDEDDEEIQNFLKDPDEGQIDDAPPEREEDDEGVDDPAGEPEVEAQQEDGRRSGLDKDKPGRANNTIRELRERAQRDEAARQNLERQMQELQARISVPQAPQR